MVEGTGRVHALKVIYEAPPLEDTVVGTVHHSVSMQRGSPACLGPHSSRATDRNTKLHKQVESTVHELSRPDSSQYGHNSSDSARDCGYQDNLKAAIKFILDTQLNIYRDDFIDSQDFTNLKMLSQFLKVSMPGSELEHRVNNGMALLGDLEDTETEPVGNELQSQLQHWGLRKPRVVQLLI